MKLLVITAVEDKSDSRIIEEAEKKNLEVTRVLYKNLKLNNLKKFDFCILRHPHGTEKKFPKFLKKLLSSFNENQLLSYKTYIKHYPVCNDKLFQHKFFGNVMINFDYFKEVKDIDIKSFPIVVKKRSSGRCKHVYLFNNIKEVLDFFKNHNIKEYIFEKYIKAKKDIRLFVLGGEIIVCVERTIKIKEKKDGYRGIGVKIFKEVNVSKEILEKGIKLAKKMECDFCGLDFLIDKNEKFYFIEGNFTPQFVVTERVIGLNIGEKLINFILDKYGKSN